MASDSGEQKQPVRNVSFEDALAQARRERTPRMALRPHDCVDQDDPLHGHMDDVVVENPTMFRAEQMDDDHLWMACYFANGERITFSVQAYKRGRKGLLIYDVGEMPECEWEDIDAT